MIKPYMMMPVNAITTFLPVFSCQKDSTALELFAKVVVLMDFFVFLIYIRMAGLSTFTFFHAKIGADSTGFAKVQQDRANLGRAEQSERPERGCGDGPAEFLDAQYQCLGKQPKCGV